MKTHSTYLQPSMTATTNDRPFARVPKIGPAVHYCFACRLGVSFRLKIHQHRDGALNTRLVEGCGDYKARPNYAPSIISYVTVQAGSSPMKTASRRRQAWHWP